MARTRSFGTSKALESATHTFAQGFRRAPRSTSWRPACRRRRSQFLFAESPGELRGGGQHVHHRVDVETEPVHAGQPGFAEPLGAGSESWPRSEPGDPGVDAVERAILMGQQSDVGPPVPGRDPGQVQSGIIAGLARKTIGVSPPAGPAHPASSTSGQ